MILPETPVVDLQRPAGLQVDLLRRADGTDNWTFAATPGAGDSQEDAVPATGEAPSLSVEGIDIADARLSYRDVPAGTNFRVAELNLSTGSIEPGQSFDLKLGGRFSDVTAGIDASLELTSSASLDTAAQQVSLRDTVGTIALTGIPAQGDRLGLEIRLAELDHDLSTATGRLKGLGTGVSLAGESAPANGLTADLELAGADYDAGRGTAKLQPFTADVQLGVAEVAL